STKSSLGSSRGPSSLPLGHTAQLASGSCQCAACTFPIQGMTFVIVVDGVGDCGYVVTSIASLRRRVAKARDPVLLASQTLVGKRGKLYVAFIDSGGPPGRARHRSNFSVACRCGRCELSNCACVEL